MAVKRRMMWRVGILVLAVGSLAWRQVDQTAPTTASAAASSASNDKSPAKSPAKTWQLGSVTLAACQLGKPDSGLTTAAWCADFPVPENRADPHSRTITLKLAVLRSRAQVPERDMLAFLAGGPGQAATESAGTVASVFHGLLAHRNVLLLDQRGTGGSNALECKDDESDSATDADVPELDADKMHDAAARCLKQVKTHADPRYYTTTIAVQDLEDVRRALGSPKLDLYGVSYGTRVAQQYAMHYPKAVRSIVLDSVVPNTLALGEDFARNLHESLQAQFARCTAQPECKKAFGDPGQTLYQLRDALRANPHQVTFRDPQSYRSVKRVLNENALATVVRLFAYTPQTAALLPLSIDAAAHGDVGPLLGQAKIITTDLADLAGSGMQYSVFCAEDVDLLTPRPQDANTILGSHVTDSLKAVCSVWPRGSRPTNFHQPLKTDTPVLLLAGQYDPVTPPRYAHEVAKHLGDARVLVLKGQGHSVMAAGCTPKLIGHFIDKLDPKTMDASCLDRLQPTPIFINFNGSTP